MHTLVNFPGAFSWCSILGPFTEVSGDSIGINLNVIEEFTKENCFSIEIFCSWGPYIEFR